MKVLDPFNKYAHLIPLPKGKTVYAGKGASNFGVNLIVKTAQGNYKEAQKLSAFLKGANLSNTLANIHHFVYHNFQYQGEGLEHNLQTLSRAYYDFRNEGINCEDASIIIVQLLSNLGIRSYVRRIHQAQNPEAATHVYVIVPKDQTTAAINGRNSYFVVDGTLPTFDLEAPFVKSIDTMAEPQVKYSVMNGANCTQATKPQIEVLGRDPKNKDVLIILVKPTGQQFKVEASQKNLSQLKAMNCPGMGAAGLNEGAPASPSGGEGGGTDWAAVADAGKKIWDLVKDIDFGLGWDEQAATKRLVDSMKSQNALQLYPSKKYSGPWRDNLGMGTINSMSADELRYFIEWRVPVWKKNMDGKDWSKTKQRVKDRYYRVAKIANDVAIALFKSKFGCYTPSGIYKQILDAYPKGSTKLADSASWEIKTFKENCASPTGGGGLFLPGAGKTGPNPGGGNVNTAGFSGSKVAGVLIGAAALTAAYKMYKANQVNAKSA